MTKTTASKLLSNVAVSKLFLSPINPRQNVDAGEIETLAQSIKACGVIQNLVGLKEGDKIGIVAGGRRLRALQYLLEHKEILPSYTVSVRLATSEEQALEWANTENAARKDLNPAEEIRAYRAMKEKGYLPEKIAIAFAQTVRHVKGRLRLAGLASSILDALQEGKITLDTAAAYTVSDDVEKQAEVFQRMQNNWQGDNPHAIKRVLMAEVEGNSDRRVVFVGRTAYEAAGGLVREDLFSEEVYYLDSALLEKLSFEKLEAAQQEYLAKGWKWAEFGLELPDHRERNKLHRIYAQRGQLSAEEKQRYQELQEMIGEGEASEAGIAEFSELKAIEAPQYSDVQKAVAGVYLAIDNYGLLTVQPGYIQQEDNEAAIAAGVLKAEDVSKAESASAASTPSKSAGYTQALFDDMSKIRTGALQTAVLDDPELAKDIAIFSMITNVYEGSLPCRISLRTWENSVEDHGQSLPEILTETSHEYMDDQTVADRFAEFRAKTAEEKAQILTAAVASSLAAPASTATRSVPFVELVAQSVELNPRQTWTPNAKFFKRLSLAQLDEVKSYIDGKPASAEFTSKKKSEKATLLHDLFNNEANRNGLSAQVKERIANWLPECLHNRAQDEAEENAEAEKLAA